MGTIRVLLAVSVMVHHGGWFGQFTLISADVAVNLFFVFSGFLMTLVLSEKYREPGSLGGFYWSRFLRIYPEYWLALLVVAAFHQPVNLPSLWPDLQAVLSNALIVGQWPWYMAARSWNPPAWTLAIEVVLYCAAPWLVRSPKVSALALAVALLVFLGMAVGGSVKGFLGKGVVAFALFCGGAVSYHWILPIVRRAAPGTVRTVGAGLVVAIIAGTIATALALGKIPLMYTDFGAPYAIVARFWGWQSWAICAAFLVAVPFLFSAASVSPMIERADRFLGDYSYSIYIFHWPLFFHALPTIRELYPALAPYMRQEVFGYYGIAGAFALYFVAVAVRRGARSIAGLSSRGASGLAGATGSPCTYR